MENKIIKCLAYNGRISIICADTTKLIEKARLTHDLSPLGAAAFGRLLTMTSIMASEMKNKKDKLTVQVKGNGPINKMLVVANNDIKVKGYILNPQVDLPLNEFGKLDVGGAIGPEGFINVIKDIGLKDPYVGVSPLVTGELGDDFASYFVNSEQRQSAVALGVLVNKDGIKSAGGYLINPMPDATEEDITSIEKAIYKAGAISKLLEQKLSLLDIVKKVTGDDTAEIIEENIEPKYECDCSKTKMETALISIGKEDLQSLILEDQKAELVCHFCNKKYDFNKEELENILNNISKQ